jgi:hypothetical protein
MATSNGRGDGLWSPASQGGEGWPWRWDGAPVGDDVRLEVWIGPRSAVGSTYFQCYLSAQLGRPVEPVVVGLQNQGTYPGFNWVEVLEFQDVLKLDDGRNIAVPPAVEKRIFEQLATAVPPGGHLMVEYDSAVRAVTASALAAKVPPIATPLGYVMHLAGCGDAFRDWYVPGGGREGPRKLQGFRAVDADHARRRGLEMLAELRSFMQGAAELDWDIQAKVRPLGEAAIDELSARFEPA